MSTYAVRLLLALLLTLAVFTAASGLNDEAAVQNSEQEYEQQQTYTAANASTQAVSNETCLSCHSDDAVLHILATAHGVPGDSRLGDKYGCIACHGVSEAHARLPASVGGAHPDVVFSGPHASSAEEQDTQCLACHVGAESLHWQGSAHEFSEVSCSDCHVSHTRIDPILTADHQAEACYACHLDVREKFHRPFAHPVRDGEMVCTDCHEPHGSPSPGELIEATANENCFSCHAEFRGPFLWDHPPVREDCMLCHQPHGSIHRNMLTQRTPWLCQQCHLAQFHPSTALSGTGLPGDELPSGSQLLLGRDCMNCHVNVHGSNHPSGPGQTR